MLNFGVFLSSYFNFMFLDGLKRNNLGGPKKERKDKTIGGKGAAKRSRKTQIKAEKAKWRAEESDVKLFMYIYLGESFL